MRITTVSISGTEFRGFKFVFLAQVFKLTINE